MAEALSGLQRNRIHRALSRPNLLMGADRELVLLTGLAAVILIFVVLTAYSAVVRFFLISSLICFRTDLSFSTPR